MNLNQFLVLRLVGDGGAQRMIAFEPETREPVAFLNPDSQGQLFLLRPSQFFESIEPAIPFAGLQLIGATKSETSFALHIAGIGMMATWETENRLGLAIPVEHDDAIQLLSYRLVFRGREALPVQVTRSIEGGPEEVLWRFMPDGPMDGPFLGASKEMARSDAPGGSMEPPPVWAPYDKQPPSGNRGALPWTPEDAKRRATDCPPGELSCDLSIVQYFEANPDANLAQAMYAVDRVVTELGVVEFQPHWRLTFVASEGQEIAFEITVLGDGASQNLSGPTPVSSTHRVEPSGFVSFPANVEGVPVTTLESAYLACLHEKSGEAPRELHYLASANGATGLAIGGIQQAPALTLICVDENGRYLGFALESGRLGSCTLNAEISPALD